MEKKTINTRNWMIGIERGTESKRLYENTITAVTAVVAIDTRAAHRQRLTGKGTKAHGISMNDKGLEEPDEFLALRLAGGRPIAPEDEAGDRRDVEALAEARIAKALAHFTAARPNSFSRSETTCVTSSG